MRDETQKYTDNEILVTPFGVDIDKFKSEKIFRDNKEEIVIGTIKALEDKYGIEYLIRAFEVVKNRNRNMNIKLEIAGKGSKEKKLKELCNELNIREYVKFLGFVNPNDVPKTLNNFDIAVFPSILDSESFGVAAVEAEACGIPVIVSDVGGLMESTKPGYSSLVVKRKDTYDLAKKLEKLILDNNLRESMGNNARKFVEENYNYIDNFNYIDSIYLDLIRK